MATLPPPSAPPPPPQSDPSVSVPLSWEGERMFNIYIYDYCFKRGFRKTARELMAEADLPPDSTPPINARQGLLFEWWSVFWVLFTAKSNGTGSEEAMLYTQHQQIQRANAQRIAAQVPGLLNQQGQPTMPPHQPPSSLARLPNGQIPRGGLGMPFPPNGPLANGVVPPQASMPPSTFSMTPGGPPTSNGIPGQPPPPGSIPANQPPNYQPILPGQQRPSISGPLSQQPTPQAPGQQRPTNGPFQSPSLAHSPQNPPPQSTQSQHPQPPMSQLPGPSPRLSHLNRPGMVPNQGMNTLNSQQGSTGPNNAPTPGQYPQGGQPPSRTGTPGQNPGGMLAPSPSLATRQPPGGSGPMIPGNDMSSQIMGIPHIALQQIRNELGIQEKDPNLLTAHDKQHILTTYRAKQQKSAGPPENAVAGPSNPMLQSLNQQRNPQPSQQRNQPPQLQQRTKRNSSSPGDDDLIPTNDTSPPDRKRIRRSSIDQNVQPLPYPPGGQGPIQHSQPPGAIPQPMMMTNNPMMFGRSGAPIVGANGAPQHPGQPPMGGGPMGITGMAGMSGQQMGVPMGGGMNPHTPMGPPGPMAPHMQNPQMQARDAQFRAQGMIPKQPPIGAMAAGSPAAGDNPFTLGTSLSLGPGPGGGPGFGPGVAPNRIGQAKTMMPPPSPAMNGAPKDQAGTPGPGGQSNPKNPMSLESPRNQPMTGPTPNVNGGPPTPVPSAPQNQNTGGPGPGPGPQPPMAPSPSALLGGPTAMNPSIIGPPSLGNQGGISDNIFTTEFINSVASSLDEFDNSMFRPDGDINFERDFGQWFNPDDVSGLDPMK